MADINVNKNAVEIRSELKANGTKIEYIVIDGQKIGIMGSVNETDRAAALKTLQAAYIASNGDIMEMMQKLSAVATIEEKAIEPDEVVVIRGKEIMLSYTNRKTYTMCGKEIANCDDLPDMPKESKR
jgi:hypothetical protein